MNIIKSGCNQIELPTPLGCHTKLFSRLQMFLVFKSTNLSQKNFQPDERKWKKCMIFMKPCVSAVIIYTMRVGAGI